MTAKKISYLYCILPGGNAPEFKLLDKEIRQRKITAYYCDIGAEGRLYRISKTQTKKLPKDEKGPYLGDDTSGHAMYPLNATAIKHLMQGQKITWVKI